MQVLYACFARALSSVLGEALRGLLEAEILRLHHAEGWRIDFLAEDPPKDAKASYTDLNDGKEFGGRTYNTTSSAWGGVFAKMSPQQVDQIATKVFGELATATPK
ncbi:MAG: hypothetical protein ACYDBZ_00310 [Steroidobacteraceae bacterium]